MLRKTQQFYKIKIKTNSIYKIIFLIYFYKKYIKMLRKTQQKHMFNNSSFL